MKILLPLAAAAAFVLSACAAPSSAVGPLLSAGELRSLPVAEGEALTPDGVRLHYRVAGTGDAVVIAPFALYHGRSLDPLARGRRIVTYDPRGRGRSAAVPPAKVSLDALLVDLDTVRRAVGAERVAIIGWSGAGMETFVYAMRHPGRVTRLVQLAPVAPRFVPYGAQMMADRRTRTDAAAMATYEDRVRSGAFAGKPEEQCRESNAVSVPPLLADSARAALIPDVCASPNEHPDALAAYFGALFSSIDGYDWRGSLASVTIPRLIIHGERDNIPLAGSEEWVMGQPNARLRVIAGAGHFPAYEQPEATLEAIAAFLGGDWPQGAEALPAR
ncbi:MAG TPA: alpha/beta hydrolase [Allosphingosinicella sp.]|jgi:pimeloyl-ACP methyl ester carboxylesterase